MKTNTRILTAAALALFVIFPVFPNEGQDGPVSGPAEPSETEIILPQMYLEIEDLTIEEIDAVIPDDSAVMLSSLELPLPSPGDIEIPAGVFAMSDDSVPPAFYTAGADGESAGSFFSEGSIGVGTSSGITGDINLYHIGLQPDFRLRYFHDSYDGFAGRDPGQGFSGREELIEAEIDFRNESLSADLLVEYNELENGLQGAADYFTATRRNPSLDGSIDWSINELLSLSGALGASMSTLQLNSQTPLSFGFFTVDPSVGISFGNDKINGGLRLDYNLNGRTDGAAPVQDLGGALTFSFEPASVFRLEAEAGILWNAFTNLYYPFAVEISGTASAFDYDLSGGYRAYYADRDSLLDIFPAAAGPESGSSLGSLPLTRGWFAEGGFRWNVSDMLSLNTSAAFSVLENALRPSASGLTGFSAAEAAGGTCLDTGAGVYLRITDNFSMGAGWTGQMLNDLDWYRPRHNINGEIEYTTDSGNLGVSGTADFNVYDDNQSWYTNDWLPEFGLEAYLRIADGLVLSVEGRDLAAGFLESGRTVWGDYLDKGVMLQARVKISF